MDNVILGNTKTRSRSTAYARFTSIFKVPIKIFRAGYQNGKAIFVAVPLSLVPLQGKTKTIFYKELRGLRRSFGLCLRCGNGLGSAGFCDRCQAKKGYVKLTHCL